MQVAGYAHATGSFSVRHLESMQWSVSRLLPADAQPCRHAAGSVENSRTTLEFAKNAKKLTMRPQLNEVRDEQAIIRKMAAEIQELRKKLVGWPVRRPGHLMDYVSFQGRPPARLAANGECRHVAHMPNVAGTACHACCMRQGLAAARRSAVPYVCLRGASTGPSAGPAVRPSCWQRRTPSCAPRRSRYGVTSLDLPATGGYRRPQRCVGGRAGNRNMETCFAPRPAPLLGRTSEGDKPTLKAVWMLVVWACRCSRRCSTGPPCRGASSSWRASSFAADRAAR